MPAAGTSNRGRPAPDDRSGASRSRFSPAGWVCYADRMLDTHAVAQSLTAAEFTPAQADAITAALRSVVEQGDHVTSDQFKAGIAEMRAEQRAETAEVRTEIANLDTRLSTQIAELRTEQRTQIAEVRTKIASLETRLIRWMVGTVLATGALTVGILRLFG